MGYQRVSMMPTVPQIQSFLVIVRFSTLHIAVPSRGKIMETHRIAQKHATHWNRLRAEPFRQEWPQTPSGGLVREVKGLLAQIGMVSAKLTLDISNYMWHS